MKCEYCTGNFGKDIKLIASPLDKLTQPNFAQIAQVESDAPGVILWRSGIAQGTFDINYCFVCGKRLTDKNITKELVCDSDTNEVLGTIIKDKYGNFIGGNNVVV